MTQPRVVTVPDTWPIDNLHPYENNVKNHPPEQVQAIARSIREFGMDQPIVVDGAGVIIKGHGRWMAAKSLGMKEVPVIVRTDLSAKQAAASRLADNRVAEGDIDTEKLHAELRDIASDDFDLSAMGFNDHELEFLTTDLGEMDEGAVMRDASAVETSVSTVERDTEELAQRAVPVTKAFGFKEIPGEHAPLISDFMNNVEAETGKSGAEALISWVKALMQQKEEA